MRSLYCAYGVKIRMLQRLKTSKTLGPVVLWLTLLAVLLALPTGYESALSYQNADRVDALVNGHDYIKQVLGQQAEVSFPGDW